MKFLSNSDFRFIVANTPLFSIDLVVEDEKGNILLGKRVNRPAQGFWFVPGGRILKHEKLDDAFLRLTQEELGIDSVPRSSARLLGLYEHLYEDSVFGDQPDTHYIVAGYHIRLDRLKLALPKQQHSEYRWWSKEEMKSATEVHINTSAYLADLSS